MTEAHDRAFLDVEQALLEDPDADVRSGPDGFEVRGVIFARRTPEGGLLVDLPPSRASDLLARGVADAREGPRPAKGRWVSIADPDDWVELASEAHQFVGEPAVGRDS